MAYLRALPLHPHLDRALAEEFVSFLAWAKRSDREATDASRVVRGLRYLAPGPSADVPAEQSVLSDLTLVAGAPRFRALLLLLQYLLMDARRFDLSLLAELEPLERRLPGVAPAANLLAVLAAAAEMPSRASTRRLPRHLVEEARSRVRELAFRVSRGIPYADLPDLAYDLRLVSFDHDGFSFSLQPFTGLVRAFRPHAPYALLVLPEDGTAYDARGYAWRPTCSCEPALIAHVRTADAVLEANAIIGADGLCRRAEVRLGPPVPDPLLAPGDDALEMHVGPGADLSERSVTRAMTAARHHYRQHFPDYSPQAAFMVSWLLDPQLRSLLPRRSRIARFQTLFRLYPARYDPNYARECVLGSLTPARPPTALQQALLILEEGGGCLKEGGGFLPF
ncbi:MAG: hypothetical protein HPY83_19645 [Anaerolineae bacterium]|nr:hypothetical protein [Anaerolineae bacterium]